MKVRQAVLVPCDYGGRFSTKLNLSTTLPEALRDLTIVGPNERIIPWLEDLADVALKPSAYPHLRQIKLACHWNYGKQKIWFDLNFQPLQRTFKEMDIDLYAFNESVKPLDLVKPTKDHFFDEEEEHAKCFDKLFEIWKPSQMSEFGEGQCLFDEPPSTALQDPRASDA
ncbi:hypothetical protein BDV96DRAFT_654974 [Lophiotrema nucula]|uniref:Uncharacterized protein n=1 Tax=Lophiotrema nucula TaxID=690887 RepID=A0A6A5YFQ7_9PLEO|nr:hypothetical protein BDV96DRAFT_654974 [Lophiotrema nucula]